MIGGGGEWVGYKLTYNPTIDARLTVTVDRQTAQGNENIVQRAIPNGQSTDMVIRLLPEPTDLTSYFLYDHALRLSLHYKLAFNYPPLRVTRSVTQSSTKLTRKLYPKFHAMLITISSVNFYTVLYLFRPGDDHPTRDVLSKENFLRLIKLS